MTTTIHPTAIVDPKAELGEGVDVGPYAIIEARVQIGDRTKIGPMVHIQGTTTLGPDNQIYTGVTLGFPPQYLGFNGAPTRLIIGARNVIREYANIHRGLNEESHTTVGDDNFFMGFSHIAHDCHVGSRIIIANGALLGGHVCVDDRTFISGNVVVHQFCRIGRLAMIGGSTKVTNDIPPFTIANGIPAQVRGLNVIGLRRADVPGAVRQELKNLLREIYINDTTVTETLAGIKLENRSDYCREMVEFLRSSKRGITAFSLLTHGGRLDEMAHD